MAEIYDTENEGDEENDVSTPLSDVSWLLIFDSNFVPKNAYLLPS